MDAVERSRASAGYPLLEAMPLGVVVTDRGGEILHANSEFLRMFGLTDLPAGQCNVAAFVPSFLTDGTTKRREPNVALARSCDGTEFSVTLALTPVDIDGRACLVASMAPVTGEAAGFNAFRDVFDNAPYGLALVAPDGLIRRANARFCAMFGFDKREIEGCAIETLAPQRVQPEHGAMREAYSANPTARSMGEGHYLTGRRKDGVEFPVEIGLCGVATEAGPMICAAVTDVTRHRRAEHRLREANEQLEEFTYVAAHDLRSPMRGMANLIEFVLEDYGAAAPESVVTNLHRMQKRVASMERLIDDLLAYARASKGAVTFEPIALSEMVQDVLNVNAPPPGLRLNVRIGSAPFEGARTPLLTTIRNLFSNAIKHHDREEMEIGVHSRDEGDFVIIDIVDDGPGIPQAAQQRVFKLFQTLAASPKHEGGGLGLAVARRLVTQHGGRLELISADGRRGCTFRIWWPRLKRTDYDA